MLFAGKNHAFYPRAQYVLGALAESAAGDFQPIQKRKTPTGFPAGVFL